MTFYSQLNSVIDTLSTIFFTVFFIYFLIRVKNISRFGETFQFRRLRNTVLDDWLEITKIL